MKIHNRPTVTNVDIECRICKTVGTVYFTNEEVLTGTDIQQWCVCCDSTTVWEQK